MFQLAAVVLSVAFVLAVGCPDGRGAPSPGVLGVQVARVDLVDSYRVVENYSGRVESRRRSKLGFDTPGRLSEILVEEGEVVAEGQALARLDRSRVEASERVVAAKLGAARARWDELSAKRALAEQTLLRNDELRQKGTVSQSSLEAATADRDALLAELRALDFESKQASAELEAIRVHLEALEIRAPFAGEILYRWIDEGEVADAGEPVVELSEIDHLEVRVEVPERVAQRIQDGDVEFALVSGGRAISAIVRGVARSIDPATQTRKVILEPTFPSGLMPGQLVRLRVPSTLRGRGAWLPLGALVEAERGLWSVFTLAACPTEPKERHIECLQQQIVELLHADIDRAFVRGTIRSGDRAVATGVHRLALGQRVIAVPPNVEQAAVVTRGEAP